MDLTRRQRSPARATGVLRPKRERPDILAHYVNHPRRKQLVRLSAYFLAALCLALLAARLADDWSNWPWHVGTLGSAWLILMLSSIRWFRVSARWFVPLFTVGQAVAAAAVSLDLVDWPGGPSGYRVQLFYDNPNLLGAALATSSVASLLLVPWPLSIPVFLMAFAGIVFTGSRLSLVAALIGLLVWGLLQPTRSRWVAGAFASLVITIGGFLALIGTSGQREANVNLLAISADFQEDKWQKSYAESIEIVPDSAPGPLGATKADRIIGESTPQYTLVIYQSVGRSEQDVPYIASIYLRSDIPQRLVLSTQLSRTVCEVDVAWRRCVTPVGYGNDHANLQLRLETIEKPGRFDVFAWGAQIERGLQVSPLQVKQQPLVSPHLLQRLTPSISWIKANAPSAPRFEAFQLAWADFREAPIAGHGLDLNNFAERFQFTFSSPYAVRHPHNLVLYVLASMGLLGLTAWLIAVGVSVYIIKYGGTQIIPLFVAVLTLNIADLSFYSAGGYYVFWLVLGHVSFSTESM